MRSEREARAQGYLALVAVQLCFGLFPIFGKWAFVDFSAASVAAWRMLVAGSVLSIAAFAIFGRGALPAAGDFVRLFLCSLLGVTLNMLLYLEGLKRSTAVNAGLIMPMIPVFTFGIAVAVRQERFSLARGLGILVALSGTLVLALSRGADLSSATRLGNLMMVVNAFCYSLYLVFSRPLLKRYPPLVVTAWVFLLSIWAVPLFAWQATFVPEHAAARSWWSLAFVLVFPTVLAYLLNAFALSRVSASTTAVFIYFQSVITIVAAVMLLGEVLTTTEIVSGTLVFAGTWLVLRRPRTTAAELAT